MPNKNEIMKRPPQVELVPGAIGETQQFSVMGWQEIHDWATVNHPLFSHTVRQSKQSGLDEVATLRLLVGRLLASDCEHQNQLLVHLSSRRDVVKVQGKPSLEGRRLPTWPHE